MGWITCHSMNVITCHLMNVIFKSLVLLFFFFRLDCKTDDFVKKGKIGNTMFTECFDRCNLSPKQKLRRQTLFASEFPVTEYKDNIGRIGRMIMDLNVHCHNRCEGRDCKHPFLVDFSKHPDCRSRITERPCGLHCTKHETKRPHQKTKVDSKKCAGEFFGLKEFN